MSTPISKIESITKEPQLEVDPDFEATASPDLSETEATQESQPPTPQKSRMGLVAIVLGILLLASIAINVQQARVTASLEAEARRFEIAMNEAIAVVEQETVRANSAESTLGGIGDAVDTVNDRIESLQQALGELRASTLR